MLALLPESIKKRVLKEYLFRVFSVALFALCILGFISILTLLPYISLSQVKSEAVESRLVSIQKEAEASGSKALSQSLSSARELLWALRTESTLPTAELFSKVTSVKPRSVLLNSFAFTKSETETQLVVDGIAKDRDALLLFVQELKKIPSFKSANVPVSNFAQEKDISFSITVLITNES